jgi:hypothetical protein
MKCASYKCRPFRVLNSLMLCDKKRKRKKKIIVKVKGKRKGANRIRGKEKVREKEFNSFIERKIRVQGKSS